MQWAERLKGGSVPSRKREKGFSGLSQSNNFREHSRRNNIKQSWAFRVEQQFWEVLVSTPSKVTHLNLSPGQRVATVTGGSDQAFMGCDIHTRAHAQDTCAEQIGAV